MRKTFTFHGFKIVLKIWRNENLRSELVTVFMNFHYFFNVTVQ
jgi:hypothetical protein